MHRRTAVDLIESDTWAVPEDEGGPSERARARAAELAERIRRDAAEIVSPAADIDDPVERAKEAESLAQVLLFAHDQLTEIRNAAIDEALARPPKGSAEAGELSRELADALLVSEGHLRVIRSRDRRGKNAGKGRSWQAARVADKLTEDYLRQAYVAEGKSLRAIAQEQDVAVSTVADYLDSFGIPKRGPRKARQA